MKQIDTFPALTPPSRIRDVLGISRSTALRLEADSSSGFPARIRVTGVGLTAWRTAELLEWAENRQRVRRW